MTVIWSRRLGDQVGLAGQHGTAAPEVEGVLPFGQYRVALLLPPLTLLVKQGGVVQEPAGLVEVGGHAAPAPALVLGLEPGGPFAGTFSGEQPGQPCDPYVGTGGAKTGHALAPDFLIAAREVGTGSRWVLQPLLAETSR